MSLLRQYLCFDLVTGRLQADHLLKNYLCEHGATESDFAWFQNNTVSFDIFGINFYPWSHGELKKMRNGSIHYRTVPTSGDTIEHVIRAAYKRYQMPIMITETSSNADIQGRMSWMDETIRVVRAFRAAGIPVLGYTWFPLFTMIDWAYRKGNRPLKSYLIHLGMYDSSFNSKGELCRHRTSLVNHFQEQMKQPMPPLVNALH